jgi:protein O-GlcNAc transferase
MIEAEQLLEMAEQALARKNYKLAENYCNKILAFYPDHQEALHLLGIVCGQEGKLDEAVYFIAAAIKHGPANDKYYSNLGEMLRRQGNLAEAIESFRIAEKINPASADIKYNLANTLKADNNFSEAIYFFREAIKLNPNDFQAYYNLGNTLRESGDHLNAVKAYQQALKINNNLYDAHYNISLSLQQLNRLDEAIYHHQECLRINPDWREAYRSLAVIFETQGKIEEARQNFRELLSFEPDNLSLKLEMEVLCPVIAASNAEIDNYRAALLKTIETFTNLDFKVDLNRFYENIQPPSSLIYQGREERFIKEKYAGIFRDCFSGLSPLLPFPERSRRVGVGLTPHPRIGFLVTGGNESIFTRFMKGIINNLGADFALIIFCETVAAGKKIIPQISNPNVTFIDIPKDINKILEIAETVKKSECDILYFWEVGTDSLNYFLPFFKLAPVQCTSLGWPETTGIKEMDYFISGELMEPESGAEHYSEQLIKLNNLPFYMYYPSLPEEVKQRSFFGFGESEHLYFCTQNLRKIHPDFDKLAADILRKDPQGILILIEDKYPNITMLLKNRISGSQADVADRIRFLPRLSYPDFLSLTAQVDVVLDSLYFVGANTTYDTFAVGTPIVTIPGKYQRGRFTYAAYRQMGIEDCIAFSEDEYVNIALKVGGDKEYRNVLSGKIKEGKSLLFEDISVVQQLSELFKKWSDKPHPQFHSQ